MTNFRPNDNQLEPMSGCLRQTEVVNAAFARWTGNPRHDALVQPTTRMNASRREVRSAAPFTRRLSARTCSLLLLGFAASGLSLPPSVAQAADPAVVGEWGPVRTLPWRPVHSILLPTGKVMFYPNTDDPILWDPIADTLTDLPLLGYSPFCSGHSLMADGRVLITSGSETDLLGLPNASIYDPVANTFTALPDMNGGRWYPTQVTLGNGDVVTMSGNKEDGTRNTIPQVWQASSNSWRDLTGADMSLALYPAAFLASNGKVFVATSMSRYLDTSGAGSWTDVAKRKVGGRDNYGSAAMYDVDKVIYTGGHKPPVASAETIDLSATSPAWKNVASMPQARRQHNITILPDATLLVTGGSSANGTDINDGPKPAINYNVATNKWTTWSMPVEYRGYHSEAVLLPDARVAVIGGNNHPNLEIFSPPYLFKGPQPVISSAPANVKYGEPFFVGTADAASITTVNMLRLSAVTHTKNMNQRINKNLAFSKTSGGLNITPPSSSNRCPPGDYMLFLLNADGVPSEAKIIRINTTVAGNSAPTTAISKPANGSTFTEGATITFTGTANDNEDGNLTASLNWSSSINGAIGSGGSFSTSALTAGKHTITASATDSGSLTGSSAITVTVNASGGGGPAPAHQWRFDETSGTTAADSTGTNNATLGNVSWVAGKIGNAAAFNGTNASGEAGKIDFATGNFTVAHWVKVTGFKSFAGIFNNRSSASGNIGFHTRTDDTNSLSALIDFGTTSKKLAVTNAATGTWYHVAVSVDRAGSMKLYVNGALSGQVDISAFSATSLTNPDNVRLGRDQGSNYFNGVLDDLRLYNSALSAAEIQNLYNE